MTLPSSDAGSQSRSRTGRPRRGGTRAYSLYGPLYDERGGSKGSQPSHLKVADEATSKALADPTPGLPQPLTSEEKRAHRQDLLKLIKDGFWEEVRDQYTPSRVRALWLAGEAQRAERIGNCGRGLFRCGDRLCPVCGHLKTNKSIGRATKTYLLKQEGKPVIMTIRGRMRGSLEYRDQQRRKATACFMRLLRDDVARGRCDEMRDFPWLYGGFRAEHEPEADWHMHILVDVDPRYHRQDQMEPMADAVHAAWAKACAKTAVSPGDVHCHLATNHEPANIRVMLAYGAADHTAAHDPKLSSRQMIERFQLQVGRQRLVGFGNMSNRGKYKR